MRPKDENQLKRSHYNLPQTMSNVQSVTYGKMLNESLFTSFDNFRTKIALCSLKMSMKSSKILKWKAGVRICFEENGNFIHYFNILEDRLPFSAYATFVRSSLAGRCQAMDEDTSSQGSYQCALDCSKSAAKRFIETKR